MRVSALASVLELAPVWVPGRAQASMLVRAPEPGSAERARAWDAPVQDLAVPGRAWAVLVPDWERERARAPEPEPEPELTWVLVPEREQV